MFFFRLICFFLLFFVHGLTSAEPSTKRFRPLKIHFIGAMNGRGLQADQQILKKEIEDLGHQVTCFSIGRDEPVGTPADINIFFEEIDFHYIPYACHNWLIPNPEWNPPSEEALNAVDLVLCRDQRGGAHL